MPPVSAWRPAATRGIPPVTGGAVSGWTGGSTRRWRRIRAHVLAENERTHGGRCRVQIPEVCTGMAEVVHHTKGRRVTGDDLRFLVASCAACNLHIGDPAAHDPEPEPRTRW